MKSLGSTKIKVTKDENGKNVPYLEINEVMLVWLNGWVFVNELIGCGFEFSCCPLQYCQQRLSRRFKSLLYIYS